MGGRTLTKRDIFELTYPVRLTISHYPDRAVRRTSHGARWDVLGSHLYLMTTAHACRLACACPEAEWIEPWPVRIVIRMDTSQERMVRDALRGICGDAGYLMDATGLEAKMQFGNVWDAHLLLRAVPRIGLTGNRIRLRQ